MMYSDQEHPRPGEPVREHPEGLRRRFLQWDGPQLRGWPPWCRARFVFSYFHIYVQSYDNDIFVLLFFRWGQWECVWDGGCEKKAGWFGTFDGGGPHPSPWTSAPFKKVMAQDFVILLLKTSRGCHDSLIIMQFHLLWIFMQFHTGLWSQKVHQWPSDDRNDTSYPAKKNVTLTVM